MFSVVGFFFIKIRNESDNVQAALNRGNWVSIILTVVASYFLIQWILPESGLKFAERAGVTFTANDVFYAIFVGLIVGALMSMITEYYTAMGNYPVRSIVRKSSTGHATNIIAGLAVGMQSTLLSVLVLSSGIVASYHFAGLYGVGIAGSGG